MSCEALTGTTRSSISGQAQCRSYAVRTGVTKSSRPCTAMHGMWRMRSTPCHAERLVGSWQIRAKRIVYRRDFFCLNLS